jgi:hypothetical protein
MATKKATTKEVAVYEPQQLAITIPGDDGESPLQMLSEALDGESLKQSDLDRIKIPSGGGTDFKVPGVNGQAIKKEQIEGVILYARKVRGYYKEKYTGGKNPPDCSSFNCIDGYGDPGGKCATCPNDQFGTAHEGDGKACKERYLMFVLPPDEILPIVISAPAGSLAQTKKFLLDMSAKHRTKYWRVITRFWLEEEVNKGGIEYSRLCMSAFTDDANNPQLQTLSPEAVEAIEAYRSQMLGNLTQHAANMAQEAEAAEEAPEMEEAA